MTAFGRMTPKPVDTVKISTSRGVLEHIKGGGDDMSSRCLGQKANSTSFYDPLDALEAQPEPSSQSL